MKTVWNYSEPKTGYTFDIPKGAKFLRAMFVGAQVKMWFEVITDNEVEERMFHCIPTGEPIPDGFKYLDTCVASNGFVFHIYEDDICHI